MGIISRTNLLRQARKQIVLVDHNERSQSVSGIEEADVVGVIDHHRVSDFQTRTPPFMRMEPVGATSTLVGKLFMEASIPVPENIAGVLLSGILADTLIFRGPTATPEDRRVAETLAEHAGLDIRELGAKILSLASNVAGRSAEEILKSDFKEFRVEGQRFGVGVFETADGDEVLARRDEILKAMADLQSQGYASVLFSVVDIIKEESTILVAGFPEAVAETFGSPLQDGNTVRLDGIISRKKHIVPQLSGVASRIAAIQRRSGA